MPEHADQLERLIRDCGWLMEALEAACEVDPPNWVIGGGSLRNLVFDWLHGRATGLPRDVDLAYFDDTDLSESQEEAIRAQLHVRMPDIPFDVKNQARVHLWYEPHFGQAIPPYQSIGHAISTWPETATAVVCRLEDRGQIRIIAPFGLDDLFGGVLRRNPAQVTVEEYHRRLARWSDRLAGWPLVRVIDE